MKTKAFQNGVKSRGFWKRIDSECGHVKKEVFENGVEKSAMYCRRRQGI